MRQNNGIFLCKNIARKIHHFFCSFTLVLLLGLAPAHSAGYTCSTTKTYTSCKANYYLSSGNCNACPSSYPYSASGSTSINSCYTNVKRGCTQNNGSTPSGCASVTAWTACSCAGGTYKKFYNGTTSGTTSNETCTKTVKSVSASANRYVFGITCPACESSYPYSDGGNINQSSCYTNITRGCTQNNGSTPSGCASVTAWNACSCAGGTYRKYASGSTSGTTSNETCTKTAKTVTASSNYYVSGATCPSCSSYSSTYTKSDGGSISSSSCYTNITRGCTQNNGSTPSGCASVTAWNACSCAGGTYRKYASGSTSGTTSNETCTKTVKTVTASANYYVSGTTCPSCSSFSSTYTKSDGGSIGSGSCYVSKTKTGSQNACSQPSNSVSYTCGTCSPGTCTYKDYYSATDTTCTPTNCTKPVASATCKANFYGTTSCTACSSFNSSYPYSDQGTTSSNYCYASKTKTGSQNACSKPAGSYSHTCNSCTPGTCTYRDYYNATDGTCTPSSCTQTATVNSCAATYYKNGNACSLCSSLSSAYANSDNGNSSGTGACYTSCAAGTRVQTRNAACTTPAGSWYTSAHTVSYGSVSAVNYCMENWTSSSTSASGHDAKTDCTRTISGGQYVPTTTINARYVRFTGDSTNSVNPYGPHIVEIQAFASADGSGTNLLSGISSNTGSAAATDGSWNTNTYDQGTNIIWDLGATKSLGSIKFAPYVGDGRTYYNIAIAVSTDKSTWTNVMGPIDIVTEGQSTAIPRLIVLSAVPTSCTAGTYKTSATLALGSTSSCTACGGGKYSAAGASSCSNISAGCYGTSASSACPASCAKGTYSTGGASACANVSAGCYADTTGSTTACPKSCPAGTYGSTTGLTSSACSGSCTANYYCPAGSTSAKQNGCPSAYPYSDAGTGSSSYCYAVGTKTGTQQACSKPSNCASVTCGTCSPGTCNYRDYNGATDTTCTPTNCTKPVASVTANANHYVDGITCPACGTSYPYSDGGNISGSYCYKNATKSGSQLACSQPANSASYTCGTCTVGTCSYRDYNGATDGSCTPDNCTQPVASVSCKANYYASGTTCPACPTAYPYSDAGTTSDGSCYTTKTNTGSQIACSKPANSASYTCGTCTVGTCNWRDYKTATDTTCTPNNCTQPVSTVSCNTGYYKSGVTCPACTNKPANSSYTGTATSNSCPWSCNSGYNQTADNQCGQFCGAGITHLHLGNGASIPLYSSARTSPAINVKWNDTVCYGSLSSGKSSGLNVKVGTTTYHAVN